MRTISITLDAPVTIPDGPPRGNISRTRSYVPGSVFRGAMAGLWITKHGVPDPDNPLRGEFIELFEGSVRWTDLRTEHTSPTPPSVVECKYKPDLACEEFSYDAAVESGSDLPVECPECHGPTARGKGRTRGLRLERHTRTAVTSLGTGRTGTATDETLHTVDSIPAGTVLTGVVHTSGSDTAAQFIDSINGQAIRLGRRKTIQGRATINVTNAETVIPTIRADGRIIVRLVSDAIIIDDAGRSLRRFDQAEFRNVLGDDTLEIDPTSWVRTGSIGGWHNAAGLPKPAEVTILAGSTVSLTGATSVTAADLTRLIGRGIGVRRNEGFGAVTVNPDAWRPAARPSRVDVSADNADTPDVLFTASLEDQKWLAHLLADRTICLDEGRAGPTLAPRRRLDDMAPPLRSRVRELLASTDRSEVNAARDRLADPAGRTNRGVR